MRKLVAVALSLLVAGSAGAQADIRLPLEAKTIELKHLKPEEAVSLLRPYLINIGGSVTSVSLNIPVVTIKDVAENIPRMEKVLAKYDHSPATIRLVFQLIEADTGPRLVATATGRQVPSDLDATLRSVLRFANYRLLAQGVATSGEFTMISQQLAREDANSTFDIQANVGAIRLSDATLQDLAQTPMRLAGSASVDTMASGSVHLDVTLWRRGSMYLPLAQNGQQRAEGVLQTGLDVPLGSTVVLGTATTQKTGVAIILTVKPELVRVK